MTDFDIKKEYNNLKNKYNLPGFEDLDNEFELYIIDKKCIVLRQIRRRMNEKVIFFCNIIERVLYPNPQSIPVMYESKFLEGYKTNLNKLYRKLMVYERRSIDIDVRCDNEKDNADYIKDLFKEWVKLKKELSVYSKKLKEFWEIESKEDRKGEVYFG